MGMVEDCLDGDAESGITVVAMVALFFWNGRGILRLTVRTGRLAFPPDFFKVSNAIGLRGEHFVDFYYVHGFYLLLGHKLAQGIGVVKRNLLP